jgi:hypothetical protein
MEAGALFTVNGAKPHDPAVDAWLETRDGYLGVLAAELFAQLRRIAPGAKETLADSCPVICVGDAPFAYVNVFTNHLNLGFFQGANLPDPKGLLRGSGKSMRHVQIKSSADVDPDAIDDLMRAAYDDMVRRVRA